MPLSSPSLLTAAGDDSNKTTGNTYVTASISPTPNAQICIALLLVGGITAPTSVIGNGITYSLVASITFDTVATPTAQLRFYKGSSESPSAGVITITIGANQIGATWSVFEFTGYDVATPFPQFPTNRADTNATVSVSMGAFDSSNNGTLLIASSNLSNTYTDTSPLSSVSSTTGASPSRSLNVAYAGENVATPTTTLNTARNWGAIGIEVKSANPFFTQLDASYV